MQLQGPADLSETPSRRHREGQKGRGRRDRQPLAGRPDAQMSGNNTRRSFYLFYARVSTYRRPGEFPPVSNQKLERGLNEILHGCIGAQLILTTLVHLLLFNLFKSVRFVPFKTKNS